MAPSKKGTKPAAKSNRSKAPKKALPVTLLSGFLGSGKTTLLQHILKSDHGLRIAIIVNDIGAVNVDASLISHTTQLTQTNEKIISLQNGCICCTLRGDLLEELVRLAQIQQFDYVIVESSGISEPEQVAETFDQRLVETMSETLEEGGVLSEEAKSILKMVKNAGGVDKFAKLDTTVTVVDAFTIFHDFDTDEILSARRTDVSPDDERTVSDLMVDQIEFADVIILNKLDMVDDAIRKSVTDLIKSLNHRAKIIEASYGKVNPKEIVNTGLFDLERAQTGYGWLQDLHDMTLREVNGKAKVTPKPETEEYNIGNFIYYHPRPFHPLRLWKLIYDKFILQMEYADDDDDEEEDSEDDEDETMDVSGDEGSDEDDDATATVTTKKAARPLPSADGYTFAPTDKEKTKENDMETDDNEEGDDDTPMRDPELSTPPPATVLANKRAHPLFSRLFRSKGEFFLATRPNRAGEWSQAGAILTLTGGRVWFCLLPEDEYLTGEQDVDVLVKHDISKGGEWGDRKQEIVFIGEGLDKEALKTALDGCVLNDQEWDAWCAVMRDADKSDEEKVAALKEVFDDGFPDWNEIDEDHEGHNH
ncbi:P-loop containing nucleoside triphosphate hydrolase protein [Cristinia sonorae]|uniref:P-loop containing nucleoside triphosphate hydrolase protein n=1 Tax=Cristinia sonorae TaxID=1940300 RepID=A0A8K0UK44_9AGAR|nr:P-loop containing nucleoside triphosphate hydrolase protein [Cristinia sonorae]